MQRRLTVLCRILAAWKMVLGSMLEILMVLRSMLTLGSVTVKLQTWARARLVRSGGMADIGDVGPSLGSPVRIAHFWDETWVRGSATTLVADSGGVGLLVNQVYDATGEDQHTYSVSVFGQGHRVVIQFLSDMSTSSGTIDITDGTNVVELPCSPDCSPRQGDVVSFLPTVPQIGADLRISSQFRTPPTVAPGQSSPLAAGTSTTVTEEFGLPFAYPSEPGVLEMALFIRSDDYNPVNNFFSLGTTLVADTTCDIATSQLALGQVGQLYSDQLTTLPGGCPSPTWTVQSTLPAGLTLDAITGAISGTPVTGSAGNYTFEVMQSGFPTATMTLGLLIQ